MLTACTIVACNYLAFARVLADSFFAQHPDGSFTVLLIDDEDGRLTPDDRRIDWRRLKDIGLDRAEVHRLAGIYEVTELATAVKPSLLRQLLDEGHGEVVYLDPDIRVCGALDEVQTLARAHGIVLTPHTLRPFPRDDRRVDGFFVLAAGVYNLGFIGIGSTARPFLDWWWQVTRREALIDVARMMFTDQRWVDFVPSFFNHHILKDPSYNVAYWNLHERELSGNGSGYLVNGRPLRFFHFSGFDVDKPWLLSRHQADRPRILLSDRPALARICREYAASLKAAGLDRDGQPPYGWSRLASGVPMTSRMRRLYWSALTAAEAGKSPEPPDPFDESNPTAFLNWLNAPAESGPRRVSRYLNAIYQDRVDLQKHYPDIAGADTVSFTNWAIDYGATEEKIPVELLPPRPEGGSPLTSSPEHLQEGIRIAGYFRSELGVGEAARQLTTAIAATGIPYSTMTYDVTLNRQAHPFVDRSVEGAEYDINVLCVNADSTPRFAQDVGPGFFAGRHTIGYWFWEIEDLPEPMYAAFDVVDEVWTATDFVSQAIRAANRKPVFTVPVPIPMPDYPPAMTRAYLGLPDRFLFLLIFDFLSVVERKNPVGLVKAFTRAFAENEGPLLVLKSINGDLKISDLERLRAAAAGRSDVMLIDGYYSAEEKNALLGACDCYVSLHRAEGLGLTMAEAMMLGKPVIATAYSGNLHFMTPEDSYLVDYTRCRVPPGCEPYETRSSWADPDLDQAARYMREVFEHPNEAARTGQRARANVIARHGIATSARAITQRLEAIRDERRSRVRMASREAAQDPTPSSSSVAGTTERLDAPKPDLAGTQVMHPESNVHAVDAVEVERLETSLEGLDELAALRLSTEGRPFPRLRRAAQGALFRLLRPVTFQRRQFHTRLIEALRQSAVALRAEQARAAPLEQRLAQLTARQRDLHGVLGSLQAGSATFQTSAAAHLAALNGAVQTLESRSRELMTHLANTRRQAEIPKVQLDRLERGLAELTVRQRELRGALESLQAGSVTSASARERERQGVLESLQAASATFQTNASAHLAALNGAVQSLESRLSTLSDRLFAVPYMADPSRLLERDLQGHERLGYRASDRSGSEGFYIGFEDMFRGPEAMIRDRQRSYLPLLKARARVVDVGCGRGEMLDLLAAAQVPATGIDMDADMVAHCRAKGHTVEQDDALMYLRRQPVASIPAIFCAQVIEHLTFEQLKHFFQLCRQTLQPDGLLIAETMNPHALEAFKTFFSDLTHERPIFPEVALTLCQLAGFEQAYIWFPFGSGDLARDRPSQGEYAVVATAGPPNAGTK